MTPASRISLVAMVALAIPASSALAQSPTKTPPPPIEARMADVATVDGIIAALYESISGPKGAERDWPRMRSLMHPDARLIPTGVRPDSSGVILVWDVDTYIERAGPGLMRDGFYEQELHRETEQYGRIVHAFSTYDSRRTLDEAPFARGINSIQLWNDGSRWWIVNVFWQGENDQYPLPQTYLGSN